MALVARVEGVGLVGPGLSGWEASRAILAGREPYTRAAAVIPAPDALPAVERRRAGKSVKLALAAGMAAAAASGRPAAGLAAVFASSTGDGENLHAICEALASEDRLISPTRFHNSVHNAPSGYWGIATGATQAADSIAAFDASFTAGLIEALGRLAAQPAQPVLLDTGAGEPDTIADPALESLRHGIPAARSLPLLALLAAEKRGTALLEYLDGLSLAVTVS
jgi:hypothetical protein